MKKLSLEELNRISVEAFKEADKTPLIVVLDNVRSLNNVGSVFRTADALLLESVYLCGITATPPNNEIHKTALGAEESVEWFYFEKTIDAVSALKEKGYLVCSLEQVVGSVSLLDFKASPKQKIALILGNEVKGVQQEVVNASDCCIEIPQYGTKHSLNVSVSGGIALWEIAKQLRYK